MSNTLPQIDDTDTEDDTEDESILSYRMGQKLSSKLLWIFTHFMFHKVV